MYFQIIIIHNEQHGIPLMSLLFISFVLELLLFSPRLQNRYRERVLVALDVAPRSRDDFGRWLLISPSYCVATEIVGRRPSTAGTIKMETRNRRDKRKRLNFQRENELHDFTTATRPFSFGISSRWMLCVHIIYHRHCVYHVNGLLTCGYCIYVAATEIISFAPNAFSILSLIWMPECFLCVFRYGK